MATHKSGINLPRIETRSVQIVLLALIYFAAAKLSLLLAIPPGYATSIWPPSGIALAAALLWGTRIWPGVWLGAALVNLTVQGSPLLAMLIATGNTLEAVIGAALISRFAGRHGRFSTAEDVIKFVALSALSAMIAASIGAGSLALFDVIPRSELLFNVLTWWQGDTTGMIIVTPLIVSWRLSALQRWALAKVIEAGVLACAVILVTHFVFSGMAADGVPLPLVFIPLPFIVWAAIRFRQREVTTAIAIVFAIVVWDTIKGEGPFGLTPAHVSSLLLLAYGSTLVITGMVLKRGHRSTRAAHRAPYSGARNCQSGIAGGTHRTGA